VAHLAALSPSACERVRGCSAARALLSYFSHSKPTVCWLDAGLPQGCQDSAAVEAALKEQFETLGRQLNLLPELKPLSTLSETSAALQESLQGWPTFIVLNGVNNQQILDAHKDMCMGSDHHVLLLNSQLHLSVNLLAIGADDLMEAPSFQVSCTASCSLCNDAMCKTSQQTITPCH